MLVELSLFAEILQTKILQFQQEDIKMDFAAVESL